MGTCDERPLAEIRFSQDQPDDEHEVRALFEAAGVKIGQDIVEFGCTGLCLQLDAYYKANWPEDHGLRARAAAEFVRKRMSGSICGLPCYVPRDRYCLVHDTIGGLQLAGNQDGPQLQRYPEALPHMSRELTEDERKRVLGITAKLNADARQKALAEYGAEDIELVDAPLEHFGVATARAADRDAIQDELDARGASCPIPQPPFKCPDHAEPNWTCRKCLAQAIVDGRGVLAHEIVGYGPLEESCSSISDALARLRDGEINAAELWVRVASWSKKVTRD